MTAGAGTAGSAPWRRRLLAAGADERGATLVLVALLLTVMLGLTALVVDVGGMRVARRALVPAADAAALAAAQDLVERPWDSGAACVTARTYVMANEPEATMTDCQVTGNSGGGVVTVWTAQERTSSFLAPPDGSFEPAEASSAAAWGPPAAIIGLRPVGLCYDGSPELKQLIDNPPSSVVYLELPFPKVDAAACGGVSSTGNFLSVDFDGGAGIDDVGEWAVDGYPEPVALDAPTSTGCSGQPCADRPYAIPAISDDLDELVGSGDYVPWPIYDYADVDGVHLIGVIRARLYWYAFDGPLEYWRLAFKVEPGLIRGTCCGGQGLDGGNRVVAICGVDGWRSEECGG
ncbi:MAG: pilus assembly protein TadG-related protein [Actinomycetota bacterium]